MAKKGLSIRGITIELTGDTTGLQDSLKKVNSTLTSTQKQLKDVEKLLKLDPKNIELWRQKQDALNTSIAATKEKLTTLKTAAEQASAELANGSGNKETYDVLQREIIATEQALKSLEKQAILSTDAMQKMSVVSDTMKKVGSAMEDVGKSLTTYVTAPIVALGTAAVKTAADFDEQMSRVKAISGATGSDFDALRDKAQEMGATTKYSAQEAGKAMEYMAMAGWDTQDVLDGIAGVMNLAAASGEDLGTVSDIVTDAMTAFGLEAEKAGDFADLLAAASANANVSVSTLGESFKACAPLAASLGYSADDVTIALMAMGNAGIKGSEAGTALRNILTNLSAPTKASQAAMDALGVSLYDSEGKAKPLVQVLDELRSAMRDLSGVSEETAAEISAAVDEAANSAQEAIDKEYNAAKDKYDAKYTAMRRSLDREYDAKKASYDKQYNKLKDSLDAEVKQQQRALDAQYNARKKAYDKAYNARKKQLDSEYDALKESLDDQYDAQNDALDKQYDEAKKAYSKDLDALKKAQEQEVEALQSAYNIRVSLINKEYAERLKLIDEDKYRQIKAIEAEIDSINAKTKAEEEAIEKAEQEQKLAELQKKVQTAQSLGARKKAEEEYNAYVAEIERKALLKERQEQIEALKEKKDQVNESAEARKDAVESERDAVLSAEEEAHNSQVDALKEQQKEQQESLKEYQDEQLDQLKKANEAQLKAIKKSNDARLSALKDSHSRQLSSMKESQESQLTALKQAQSDQLDATKKGNSKRLDAMKNSQQKSLEKLKQHHEDRLTAVKKQNERELKALKEKLKAEQEALEAGMTSQEAAIAKGLAGKSGMSGFLGITNASDEDWEKAKKSVEESGESANKMAQTMLDNLNGQIAILKSSLEGLGIEIGTILMPTIEKVVAGIQSLVEKFQNLSPETKETIVKVGALVAALGPLLIIGGKISSGISNLITSITTGSGLIGKLWVSLRSGHGILGTLGTKLAEIGAGPIATVVAAVGTLVAAFVHLWNTNEDFRKAIIEIWEGIKNSFEEFKQKIVDTLNAMGLDFSSFGDVVEAVITTIQTAWDMFCSLLAPVFEGAFKLVAVAVDTVLGAISSAFEIFSGLFTLNWELFWTGVKDLASTIWEAIQGVIETVIGVITGIIDTFLGWFGTNWETVWNGASEFISGIWECITGFFTGAWDAIKGVWEGATGWFEENVWNPISENGILNAIGDVISAPFKAAYDFIAGEDGIWGKITGFFSNIWASITGSGEGGEGGLPALQAALTEPFTHAWDAIQTAWNAVTGFFEGIWTGITGGDLFKELGDAISAPFKAAYDFIAGEDGLWNKVTGFFSGIWTGITGGGEDGLPGILSKLTKPFEDAYNTIHGIWEGITGFFSGLFGGVNSDEELGKIEGSISTPFSNAWKTISDTFSNITSKITEWFSGIDISEQVAKVSDWAEGAWNSITGWFGTAKEKIEGFFDGIDISEKVSAISSWAAGAWETIKNAFNADGGVKEWFTSTFEGVGEAIKGAVGDVGEWAANTWEGIKGAAKDVGGWFASLFGWGTDDEEAQKELEEQSGTAGASAKEALLNAFAGADTEVAGVFSSMLTLVGTSINGIVTAFEEAWKKILKNTKDMTQDGSPNIKDTILNVLKIVEANVITKMATIEETITTAFENILRAFQTTSYSVLTTMDRVLGDAVTKVQHAVDDIKSALDFDWDLPYLKMPHIRITGNWDMDPPSAPSFSVKWYKDAMETGIILNNPTIFGMMNGKLLGGGDAGSEAIVGTNSLMQMIRNAVSSMATTQNVNYGGVTMNIYASDNMDVKTLAKQIEYQLSLNSMRRQAAF